MLNSEFWRRFIERYEEDRGEFVPYWSHAVSPHEWDEELWSELAQLAQEIFDELDSDPDGEEEQ
jgi:hypothetical protein